VQVVQRQHQRAILRDLRQGGAQRADEAVAVKVLDREGVELRLQRFGDRGQREIGLELRSAARQREEAARLGARDGLPDQRGLADARLAGEIDRPTLSTGEPLERLVEGGELGVTPNKGAARLCDSPDFKFGRPAQRRLNPASTEGSGGDSVPPQPAVDLRQVGEAGEVLAV
jgi:hypothetical protein